MWSRGRWIRSKGKAIIENKGGEVNNRESVGVRGEECEKEEEKGKRKGGRNQYLRGNEKNKHKVFGFRNSSPPEYHSS